MLISRHLLPVPTMGLEALEFLGLTLDPDRNSQDEGERLISIHNSAVEIWVIPTNEEWTIDRDTYRLPSGNKPE